MPIFCAGARDLPLMRGLATRLVLKLEARLGKIAIASGGFTFFADYLRDQLRSDGGGLANRLEQRTRTVNLPATLMGCVDAGIKPIPCFVWRKA